MRKIPLDPLTLPNTKGQTIYPPPFDKIVAGRTKRKLGDIFGISNFGVNQTHLDPDGASALFHSHQKQDEFIYILRGTATVRYGEEEYTVKSGDCFGFPAGTGLAHQILNKYDKELIYLEIGDRTANDIVEYPEDNLKAQLNAQGKWELAVTKV